MNLDTYLFSFPNYYLATNSVQPGGYGAGYSNYYIKNKSIVSLTVPNSNASICYPRLVVKLNKDACLKSNEDGTFSIVNK